MLTASVAISSTSNVGHEMYMLTDNHVDDDDPVNGVLAYGKGS